MALRPNAPKLSAVPPLAAPWMRPLWALRNLVRLGDSMIGLPRERSAGRSAAGLLFLGALVLRHRVVGQDLALEHPHLDAAGAVGGLGGRLAEIDVGAQRVQRHPALAVPLGAGDLGAAQAAAAIDPDALGAEPHGRLHRPLHGAAEGHPALELL